jgi:hypothetical protein
MQSLDKPLLITIEKYARSVLRRVCISTVIQTHRDSCVISDIYHHHFTLETVEKAALV